ncbi:DUF1761 domain-containing protein [Amantichitinum ursilacus]|uniref:DUF1761 domain-containing protein n=1 Tax=Amantichitinum ursilacus TaxID=857265 RepID=A0A0N0XG18_9NEIS|nr:DUF1761 domain-containing protein [Amantichitinum ursilacus]KPC49633.1 hypothetical protein WG78_19960 [Amantichitinum ursilacus]
MNTLLYPINLLAVLAATVAVTILGGIWFAGIFGRQYAAVLGRADEPQGKMPPLYIVGPALCMLVTTCGCALLMQALQISSLAQALRFGGIVGVCGLAATAMNMAINPNIPRPLAYGVLSAGYFLLSSLIISAILFWLS